REIFMKLLTFEVSGSTGTPYQITAYKNLNNLTLKCDCAAGQKGGWCKHRMALLAGDITNLTSGNSDDVQILADWSVGTDVEQALRELEIADQAASTANKRLKAAKKALARAMND
ncbi:MAG: SWIM zinc finger family protein, partial [Phycisphaerales bacterium]|nr:SWIM zinc finger family protein [Phycisphaerales bacterium]